MVDLTEDGATANVGDPSESFTQEENEEHFIETLMMRNQDGKLDSVQEVIQAILDIGGGSSKSRRSASLIRCSDCTQIIATIRSSEFIN